jgi:hypothetical protein
MIDQQLHRAHELVGIERLVEDGVGPERAGFVEDVARGAFGRGAPARDPPAGGDRDD